MRSYGGRLAVPVLRLNVVSHGLGLFIAVMMVVWVVGWTNVVHLVYTAALIASFEWSFP